MLAGFKKLVSLSLAACGNIEDISCLKDLPALQTLILSACHRIKTLRSLQGLSSLETLAIEDCQNLESIESLAYAKHLKTLFIGPFRENVDLGVLSELKELENLSINLAFPTSLEPLAALAKIRSLVLQWSREEDATIDMSPLSKLVLLEDLHFHGFENNLNLSAIADLPNIKNVCTGGSDNVRIPIKLRKAARDKTYRPKRLPE